MKQYQVTRKHPNKDASHDLTFGRRSVKFGDILGEKSIVDNLPAGVADGWIKLALERKWIKEYKAETKKAEPKKEVKVDVKKA